jgi:hypothetical protein
VDHHQGWAQRPDVLGVHVFMRVRLTESGKGQSSAAANAVSQAAAEASIDPRPAAADFWWQRPEIHLR